MGLKHHFSRKQHEILILLESFDRHMETKLTNSLGLNHLSPHSLTLLCGFLAVISVKVVVASYICMALKEPSNKHPKFLAEVKACVSQLTGRAEDSSQSKKVG